MGGRLHRWRVCRGSETLLLGTVKPPFITVKAVWSHASWITHRKLGMSFCTLQTSNHLGDTWNAISDEIELGSDEFNVFHTLAGRAYRG